MDILLIQSALKLKINNFKQPKLSSIKKGIFISVGYPYFLWQWQSECLGFSVVKIKYLLEHREQKRSILFDLFSLTNCDASVSVFQSNGVDYGKWVVGQTSESIQDTALRCLIFQFYQSMRFKVYMFSAFFDIDSIGPYCVGYEQGRMVSKSIISSIWHLLQLNAHELRKNFMLNEFVFFIIRFQSKLIWSNVYTQVLRWRNQYIKTINSRL